MTRPYPRASRRIALLLASALPLLADPEQHATRQSTNIPGEHYPQHHHPHPQNSVHSRSTLLLDAVQHNQDQQQHQGQRTRRQQQHNNNGDDDETDPRERNEYYQHAASANTGSITPRIPYAPHHKSGNNQGNSQNNFVLSSRSAWSGEATNVVLIGQQDGRTDFTSWSSPGVVDDDSDRNGICPLISITAANGSSSSSSSFGMNGTTSSSSNGTGGSSSRRTDNSSTRIQIPDYEEGGGRSSGVKVEGEGQADTEIETPEVDEEGVILAGNGTVANEGGVGVRENVTTSELGGDEATTAANATATSAADTVATTTNTSSKDVVYAVDYASKSAGALVLDKSHEFGGTSNLLTKDKDRYAIVPCEEDPKYVVIGLSEDILVKRVVLAAYERYSSHVQTFQLLGSSASTKATDADTIIKLGEEQQQQQAAVTNRGNRGAGVWVDLGTYTTAQYLQQGEQAFDLVQPAWARYLQFRFLKFDGDEHYCTLTQIKVHGSTVLQGFHEQWQDEENNHHDEGNNHENENAENLERKDEGQPIEEEGQEKGSDGGVKSAAEELERIGNDEMEETNEDGSDAGRNAEGTPATSSETMTGESEGGETSSTSVDDTNEDYADPERQTYSEDENKEPSSRSHAVVEEVENADPTAIYSGTATSMCSCAFLHDSGKYYLDFEYLMRMRSHDDSMSPSASPTECALHASMIDVSLSQPTFAAATDASPMSQSTSTSTGGGAMNMNANVPRQQQAKPMNTGSHGGTSNSHIQKEMQQQQGNKENMNRPVASSGSTGYEQMEETGVPTATMEMTAPLLGKIQSFMQKSGLDDKLEDIRSRFLTGGASSEVIGDHLTGQNSASPKQDADGHMPPEMKKPPHVHGAPNSHAKSEQIQKNSDVLAQLLQRLPSAACLAKMDFEALMKNQRVKAGGPGAGGPPIGGAVEPVFKKLTDEIKALQASVAVHDQFTRETVACYQRVLLDLFLEMESIRLEHAERLDRLERPFYAGIVNFYAGLVTRPLRLVVNTTKFVAGLCADLGAVGNSILHFIIHVFSPTWVVTMCSPIWNLVVNICSPIFTLTTLVITKDLMVLLCLAAIIAAFAVVSSLWSLIDRSFLSPNEKSTEVSSSTGITPSPRSSTGQPTHPPRTITCGTDKAALPMYPPKQETKAEKSKETADALNYSDGTTQAAMVADESCEVISDDDGSSELCTQADGKNDSEGGASEDPPLISSVLASGSRSNSKSKRRNRAKANKIVTSKLQKLANQ